MHGSPKGQVTAVFRLSGMLRFGKSRHADKQRARRAGASRPETLAEKTGLYSWSTYNAYLRTGIEFLKFVRKYYNVRDIEKVTNEHVYDFLLSKIASGVKESTFKSYAAALSKLSISLERLSAEHRPWKSAIKRARDVAQIAAPGSTRSRLYMNPERILNALEEPYRLIAELQLYCGLRISEASKIYRSEVTNSTLKLSRTKGGRPRDIKLPKAIETKLAVLSTEKKLEVNRRAYTSKLRAACEVAGETWNGSHGLRWNYANRRITDLTTKMSYERALQKVSIELGHSRPEISSWYLRR